MRFFYLKFSFVFLFSCCFLGINALDAMTLTNTVLDGIVKDKVKDKTTPVKPRLEKGGKNDGAKKDDALSIASKHRRKSSVSSDNFKKENLREKIEVFSISNQRDIKPLITSFDSKQSVGPDPFRFSISSSKDSVQVGEEFELTVTVDWVDFGVNNGVRFLPEWYKYALKVVMPKGFTQTGGNYVDYCTKNVDAQNPQAVFKIEGVFESLQEDALFKVLRGFEGASSESDFIFKEAKSILVSQNIFLDNMLRKNRSGRIAALCLGQRPLKMEIKPTGSSNSTNYLPSITFDTRVTMPFTGNNVYLYNRSTSPPVYSCVLNVTPLKIDSATIVLTNPFALQFATAQTNTKFKIYQAFNFNAENCDGVATCFDGFKFKVLNKNCSDTLGTIQAFATNPISIGQTLNLTSVYKNPSGVVASLPGGATLSWFKGGTLITSTTYPSINGYANGNYSVKVTLGNCQASSTVNVIVPCNTLNIPGLIISNITPSGCQEYRDSIYTAPGQKVSLVNKAYCAGTTYWSNGATGIKIDVYPTVTTTYTAYCKDSSCVTANSNNIKVNVTTDCNKIQIGRPSLFTDNNKLINLGDSLTLAVNGYCSAYNSVTEWTNGTTTILAGTKVAPTQNKNFYVRCKNGLCVSPYDTLRVFVKCGSVPVPTLSYYNEGSSTFPIHYAQANGCSGTVSWFNNNTYVAQGNRFLLSEYPGQYLKYPKILCSVNGCSSDFSPQFNSSLIPFDPNQDNTSTLSGSMNKIPNGNFYSFKCGESVIVNATGCRNDKPKAIYLLTPNEVTSNGLGKVRTYLFEGTSIEIPIPINPNFNINNSEMFLECYANGNSNPTWVPISYNIEASRDNPYKVPIKATNNTICSGGTSVLYAENCGGTVQWQNRITTGSWANNASGDTISVSPPANTFYRAKCMSAQCPSNPWSDSLSINIDPLLTAPNRPVIVGDTLINYALDDPWNPNGVAIRASCSGSIVWSTGQEGDLVYVRPSVTTSYTARCRYNGCLSQPSKPVVVYICAGLAPTITLSKDTVYWCGDRNVTITVSGCTNSIYVAYYYDETNRLLYSSYIDPVSTTYFASLTKIRIKCIPTVGSGCPTRLTDYKIINFVGPPTPVVKSNGRKETLGTASSYGYGYFCSGETTTLRVENCPGVVKWYTIQNGTGYNIYAATGTPFTPASVTFAPGETSKYSDFKATCTVNSCESSTGGYTIYAAKPPTPSISTTSPNQICSGASIALTATGCDGLIMWNGINGGSTMTINPVRDTTFTATCRNDYYGCESPNSNTLSFTIKPTPPQLTVSPTALTICPGDTATLTASACVGYVQWSNGVNGQVFKVVPSATTSYTAKCINSCAVAGPNSSPTNVTIEPLTKPVISALKTLLCSNGAHLDGTITLTATGCAYTVQWSNGLTGSSVTFPTTFTRKFSAVCKRNTCISPPADSLQITVLSVPLPPSITVSNRYKCVGIVRTDNVTAQGYNGGLQWYANGILLTDTTKVISVSPTVTTKYYTTSTNICGTSNPSPMDSIVIVPIPTITSIALLNKATPLVCSNNANDKLQIQANGCVGTVEWTGGELTGQNITGTIVVVKPTALTTYSARCRDRGCLSIYRDFIGNIFTERPLAMTVIGSPIAVGQSARLKATTGYAQYRWFTSTNTTTPFQTTTDSSILVSPTVQTSYFVKCDGYCSELSTQSALQNVNIDIPPVPTITAATNSICEGSNATVQLTVTGCGSGTILWDNGEINATRMVTPLFTTTYKVCCISQYGNPGAQATKTITVNPALTVKTYPVSVKVGEVVKLNVDVTPTGTYTYNWTGPSSYTSTVQNPQVTASAVKLTHQGIYTVRIGGAASICTAIATAKVTIIDAQCGCDDCATLATTDPFNNPLVAITGRNYVVENTYLTASTTIPTGLTPMMQTISYFDGLGRPIQKTAVKAGPGQEDIISTMEYDEFGREAIKRLPFAIPTNASTMGQLVNNPVDYIKNYYSKDLAKTADQDYAFAKTAFEASPLNRVLQQGAPGQAWQPTTLPTDALNHTVRMAYLINTKNTAAPDIESKLRDNIKMFTFPSISTTIEAQTVIVSLYEANQLMVNVSTDENGNKMSESKDKEGRVVCKRVQNVTPGSLTEIVETNYAYDDLGQLRFVFQPKAALSLAVSATAITPLSTTAIPNISELVFAYNYDERLRPIEKKVPGMVKTEMVYDKRDRLVYSIDGWGRQILATTGRSKGVYARYDELNRVVESGYYTVLANQTCGTAPVYNSSTNPRAFTQCKFDAATAPAYDFLATVPVLDKLAYLNNVYDAYPTGDEAKFDLAHAYSQAKTSNVKGMLVKSIDKVLHNNGLATTTNILNNSVTTIMFYDNLGRSIQTNTLNHTNKTDIASSQLDFAGRVTLSKSSTNYTWKSNTTTTALPAIVVENKTTYDYGGRVASVCQKNDADTWEPVVRNSYSKIGELLGKKMGCDIQNVDYQYNIRSWLTKINDPANLAGNNRDLFGLNLTYNDGTQFNGNITKLEWNTLSKLDNIAVPKGLQQYTYTYDKMNRLLNANFSSGVTALNALGISVSMISTDNTKSYDVNGNIGFMKRTVNGAVQDNLTYTYEGGTSQLSNRLLKIDDVGNKTDANYFLDGNTANDYTYDANGNMTIDLNKSINPIVYNHANLPTVITNNSTGTNRGTMKYYYTFTGKKVRTEVIDGVNTNPFTNAKTIEYVNGLAFKGGVLEFVPTATGRALTAKYVWSNAPASTAIALTPPVAPANQYRYEYQLKDHLGDLRVSCRCGDPKRNAAGDMIAGLEPTMAVQENHYDPWGLGFADAASNTQKPPKNTDRFQYNGKEKVSDLGLGLYEYGFRWYDPTMARFVQVDPLADKYTYKTTYDYAENRPISGIDLDGLEYLSANHPIFSGILGGIRRSNLEKNYGNNQVNIGGQSYYNIGQHLYDNNSWLNVSESGNRSQQITEETRSGILTDGISQLPRKPSDFRLETYSNPQSSFDAANEYSNPGGMCFAICMSRYNNILGGNALSLKDNSLDFNISGTIDRGNYLGYGVAGALAKNGYAKLFNTEDFWSGKAQKGASIQWWWGSKSETLNVLKSGSRMIGHSVIFHSYVYDNNGTITGFNFTDDFGFNGLPTPNTPIMKNSNWSLGGNDYGNVGNHYITGGNLIDKK
jgi:RHS repeat-associated protein